MAIRMACCETKRQRVCQLCVNTDSRALCCLQRFPDHCRISFALREVVPSLHTHTPHVERQGQYEVTDIQDVRPVPLRGLTHAFERLRILQIAARCCLKNHQIDFDFFTDQQRRSPYPTAKMDVFGNRLARRIRDARYRRRKPAPTIRRERQVSTSDVSPVVVGLQVSSTDCAESTEQLEEPKTDGQELEGSDLDG